MTLTSVWKPSPNFAGCGRVVGDVKGVVLHDCEGSLASAIATFKQPGGVSAHYIVAADGAVVQLVPETCAAFHVAAFGGTPALNRNKPPWLVAYNGRFSATNQCTIGIELEGFAATGYTDAQYQTLAELLAEIAGRWQLPLTLLPDTGAAATVVSHGWLQTDRSDPGAHFSWDKLRGLLAQQEDEMALSDDDKAILAEVHGLGGNSASIPDWINTIGVLQAQNAQLSAQLRAALAAQASPITKIVIERADGSTQEVQT